MFRFRLMAVLRLGPGALLALTVLPGPVAAATPVAPVYTDTSVVSSAAPPVELDYTATATQTIDVTLTDLGQLAGAQSNPLGSVNLVVTSGGAIVNAVGASSPPAQATLAAPGTVSFAATQGVAYQVRVVGTPGANSLSNSGAVLIALAAHGTGTPLKSQSGVIAPPQSATTNAAYFAPLAFTITQAGDYAVTLVDDQLPAPLSTFSGFVLNGINAIGAPLSAGTTTLTGLQPGAYQIWIYAQAPASAGAGLFGVKIAPAAGGTAVLDQSAPVGAMAAAGPPLVASAAHPLALKVTDLGEPVALAQLAAAATAGSALLGSVTQAAPSAAVPPFAGSIQLWQFAEPAAGNAGAYSLSLAPTSGPSLYAAQTAVADPTSNLHPYVATLATAGSYDVLLSDLEFPSALTVASYTLYQGGKSIGQSVASAAPQTVSAAAGPVVLVVTASAPPGGSGLYFVSLAAHGGGTPLLADTRGVGVPFLTRDVGIAAAGSYNFALTDLGWPAPFQTLAIAFTQGGTLVGKIYGGGTLSNVAVAEGDYTATIFGVPATNQIAGLYTLTLSPGPPVVTLTASPTSVTTGQGTKLSWTSTAAASCSGASTGTAALGSSSFTGAQAVNGSASDGPFTTAGTVTYTLTCTGAGGTTAQTASVTVTAAATSSGGGGGGLGLLDLAVLAGLALRRQRRSAPL